MSFIPNVTQTTGSLPTEALPVQAAATESRKRTSSPAEATEYQRLPKQLKTEWEAILAQPPGLMADRARLIEQTEKELSTSSKMDRLTDFFKLPKGTIPTENLVEQLTEQRKKDSILVKLWKAINQNNTQQSKSSADQIRNWFATADKSTLAKIIDIDLPGKEIASLPPELFKLTNLTYLDLSNNNLTELPAEIGKLKKLERLDLSNNHLSTLPAEIGTLENLGDFFLSNNRLSALPAEIGQLESLDELDLSNNHLSTLPVEFTNLVDLGSLDLSNNPLSSLPEGIEQLVNFSNFEYTFCK